jgi:hypothetical protein
VIVRWNELDEQGQVVLVSWANNPTLPARTQACFWTGEALRYPHISECEILDRNLDNFVMVPDGFDGGRVSAIMYRPLFEADIWVDLVEYDPKAITKMKAIMKA